MATLSSWEAGLVGQPMKKATQCSGAAVATRELVDRGAPFATAQATIAGNERHYRDLTRWNEYAAFVALTGP